MSQNNSGVPTGVVAEAAVVWFIGCEWIPPRAAARNPSQAMSDGAFSILPQSRR